ncbi:ATP-binding cassette domain-containing protein [Mesorhizobium sp. NPDC059025]|uniref:ATP-binding cassette domain-containing protein n=1 Tax=unclassified Mesorhizobium TaxID=325217 RepID=UPI0036B52690
MSLSMSRETRKESGASHGSVFWWRLAVLLALVALFAGILLTGVSVWFLGSVALAGAGGAAYTFNFHIPAALIRMFAMARTAAKYGERLVGHKAALLDQVSRRAALFSAMAAAPKVRGASWQLGDQDRLADFIDDVENMDFARLRVGLPLLATAAGLVFAAAVTFFVAPMALAAILPILLGVAARARWLLPSLARDWHSARLRRRAAGRRLGAGLGAVVPLQAEHVWSKTLRASFAALSSADAHLLRSRRRMAVADTLVGLLGPACGVVVLATAWLDGLRGEALLPAAFVAFAWLAVGEAMQGASRILLARVKEEAASRTLKAWSAGTSHDDVRAGDEKPFRLGRLEIEALTRCAPDGRPLGDTVDFILEAGHPTVLSGPSGAGKTSLLKQVAGWLDADGDGKLLGDGSMLSPPSRRQLTFLGLHDAAVLSDSVRENLFAPGATDAECWAALDTVELGERVRLTGGLEGWITQDRLSLGEAHRLNLARALLSPLPLILLDEPGEHLDTLQARRIVERLSTHLQDRILLVSSHKASDSWKGAREFRLASSDATLSDGVPQQPLQPVGKDM